jgi:hypothetical protein
MRLVAATLVVALLSGKLFGATDEGKVILKALQDVRSSSIHAMDSGRGVAEYEASDTQNPSPFREARHRIDFFFHGNDSFCREYQSEKADKAALEHLIIDNRVLDYNLGLGAEPRSVSVGAWKQSPFLVDVKPLKWTYTSFAALPAECGGEETFFTAVSSREYIHVKKDRAIVTISADLPAEMLRGAGTTSEHIGLAFDMSKGGMLVHYETSTSGPNEGNIFHDFKNSYSLDMEWRESNKIWVPSSRKVTCHLTHDGTSNDVVSKLTFDTFEEDPKSVDAISTKQINVPDGTPVVDRLHNTSAGFSPGILDDLMKSKAEAKP